MLFLARKLVFFLSVLLLVAATPLNTLRARTFDENLFRFDYTLSHSPDANFLREAAIRAVNAFVTSPRRAALLQTADHIDVAIDPANSGQFIVQFYSPRIPRNQRTETIPFEGTQRLRVDPFAAQSSQSARPQKQRIDPSQAQQPNPQQPPPEAQPLPIVRTESEMRARADLMRRFNRQQLQAFIHAQRVEAAVLQNARLDPRSFTRQAQADLIQARRSQDELLRQATSRPQRVQPQPQAGPSHSRDESDLSLHGLPPAPAFNADDRLRRKKQNRKATVDGVDTKGKGKMRRPSTDSSGSGE